jgi:D-alanine-D-alanine ligase
MKLGFTYDQREDYLARGHSREETAEFDGAATINRIATTLESLGYGVDRIGHVHHLVGRLARGDRWDLVFNIAEGLRGPGREAQIPALLEAYDIPFVFSSSWTMMVTLDKALTKTVLAQQGVATAPWCVAGDPGFVPPAGMRFPLFVKPVGEGSSMGVLDQSLVHDAGELASTLTMLLQRYRQPVLVESFLAGREFTVGVLGTGDDARVLGVMELHLDRLGKPFARSADNKDIDHTVTAFHSLCEGPMREAVGKLALQSWRVLGGRDAGRVDIRCDEAGGPHVLEVNALPGLTPGYSDLCILAGLAGLEYSDLLAAILREATTRLAIAAPQPLAA